MPSQSPIFVIGTGRSGTTLLRLMLSAHPRIYITHEASFYVWEALYRRKAPRREFLEYFFQTHSYRWLRLDPARVTAHLPDPLPPERIGEAYAAVMREKAAQYGRVRFGDKTPSHSSHLARIFEDFPDARVVHIVRDPRGTALSLSRMPWACASLRANAIFCELERRGVAKYRDRILSIRLEDLLAEPRATMGRVLDFVGEPWDDAVLDHDRHLPDRNDMPPLPWLESSAQARGAAGAQWSALTPLQVRAIEGVAATIMKESGYAPAVVAAEPGRWALFWNAVRETGEMLRYLAVYALLAYRGRDPHALYDAGGRALFRRVNPGSWARYPGFEVPVPPPLLRSGSSG
jgi:hypothetical protein